MLRSIDICQNRLSTDQYHMAILRAHIADHLPSVLHNAHFFDVKVGTL